MADEAGGDEEALPGYDEATAGEAGGTTADAGAVDAKDLTVATIPASDKPEGEDEETFPAGDTPQKQRKAYKDLGYKVQSVGDEWYPVSKKWYDEWVKYTAYDQRDEDIVGGLENLHLREEVVRPGPISNEDLQDADNPSAIKREIEEHLTHEWVHSDQWKLLHHWYGGGPAFPRKVCERGSTWMKEKYILTWPTFLKFVRAKEDCSGPDFDNVEEKSYAADTTFTDISADFEGEETSTTGPVVHFFLKFDLLKDIYVLPKTKKGVEVTKEDLDGLDKDRYVELPDDYLETKLEALPEVSKHIIVVEKKNSDGEWPMGKSKDNWKEFETGDIIDGKDSQSKWYEGFIRLVGKEGSENEGKLIMHFMGWNAKWDEIISATDEFIARRGTHTTGPHRPQAKKKSNYYSGGGYGGYSSWSYYSHDSGPPAQRGVVGLRNLGNTCFMNSTLQCMAQTPKLTPYFLSGEFVHHVNKDNPLGWKGKVAEAWARLLTDMHGDKYTVVAPRDFKQAIGEVAPRFMGYSQQDSQELLSFLLDGLHEDLNIVKKKPATEPVESKGRPDAIVAAEAWRTYLMRNQSEIVNLLQGQYKSTVDCPDCPRVSVTFDPYMFLSVPLPSEKFKELEFTYVSSDPTVPPTVYGLQVPKFQEIGSFKKTLAKKFGVDADDLFVCDVWKSKIHRDFKQRDSVQEINRRSDDIFVYHAPKPAVTAAATAEAPAADAAADASAAADDSVASAATADAAAADGAEAEAEADGDAGAAGAAEAGDDAAADGAAAAAVDPEKAEKGGSSAGVETGSYNNNQSGSAGAYGSYTPPPFKTFVVISQVRIQVKSSYYYSQGYREEDTPIGIPLLLTVSMTTDLTFAEARRRLFEVVKPYLVDQTLTLDSEALPFSFHCTYGYTNSVELTDTAEETVPLTERNLKFVLHFTERAAYNEDLGVREMRARDESAPALATDKNGYAVGARRGEKPVSLDACFAAYCEDEVLSEEDAWYCSNCKAFKCARKKIDLWSVPDILIIHLKRFAYTRVWRDRINTVVDFPIEGLDMSRWVLSPESQENAIYDLYGVSNHMGGMGGGHYTAYAKNLYNDQWYHLDDSRTSPVSSPRTMISASAYVLYYKRRTMREEKHRPSKVAVPSMEELSATAAETE